MTSLQLAAQNLALAVKLLKSCGKVDTHVNGDTVVIYVRDEELFNSIPIEHVVMSLEDQYYPYKLLKKIDDIEFYFFVYRMDVERILPDLDGEHHAA